MSQPIQPGAKKKQWPRWARFAAWFFGVMLVLTVITTLGLNWYASKQPGGKQGFEKQTEAKLKIMSLEFLLALNKRTNGKYPTEDEGLGAAFAKRKENKDQIGESDEVRKSLLDPWQRRYRYRCPGTHNKDSYDLYSLGPDGIEDTEDDIGNW